MTPARRWLWGLGGLVVVLAAVLVVVLVTRDGTETAGPRTTAATTASGQVTTTLPLPALTDDPGSYAEFLFVAWENDDRAAASEVASSEAVDQLFAQPYSPDRDWVLDTCLPAAGSLYCTWNGAGGDQLQMVVRTLTGGLPVQVVRVDFTTS